MIVCTGKDFKTEMSAVKELGAFDVVIKPFVQKDLIAKVERYFSPKSATVQEVSDQEAAIPSTEFRHELNTALGSYRLWGTRGSIPICEPQFLRHGGNTSCMAIEYGEHRIIFDAGSGIRPLGMELMSGDPRKIHLFITHTHWDHIQGFPFFSPLYNAEFDITVYGAEGFGKDLRSIFQGQLDTDYFPVQMDDMAAKLNFQTLTPEPVQIGDLRVSWAFTQHPGATVAYRVDTPDRSIAWVPDNEFLRSYTGSPFELTLDSELVIDYEPIIRLLTDVDFLLHECQYTHEEYLEKIGWGHLSVPNACLLAKLCRARRWVVIHHDPMHDDNFLQRKLNLTRQLAHELASEIEVSHGFDGHMEYL